MLMGCISYVHIYILYIYIDTIYIWVVLDSRFSKIYYSGSPRILLDTYAFCCMAPFVAIPFIAKIRFQYQISISLSEKEFLVTETWGKG